MSDKEKKMNENEETKEQQNEEQKNATEIEIEDTAKEAEATTDNAENNDNETSEDAEEKLKQELGEMKDRHVRKIAEFENYKRRVEVEQQNLLKYSGEMLIRKLLPVVDDFERSLAHIDGAKDPEAVKKGVTMIYEKLMRTFKEIGVEKIDSVGKPFDVDFHEAIMKQPSADAEPMTVLQEVETGYLYKDKVLRHSKVVVADEPLENADATSKTKNENGKDSE